jgi:hypothetical protein
LKKPRVSIPVDVLDKNEWKHNVQGHEVYEVFDNHPYVRLVEKGHRPGEDLYSAFGKLMRDVISLLPIFIRRMGVN